MHIKFLLFLPLDAWTGGSLYQRAVIDHLRQKGHEIQTVFVDDLSSPDSLMTLPEPDLLLWDGMSIIKWFSRWERLPVYLPQVLIVHGPFSTRYLQAEPWLPYPPHELFAIEYALFARMDRVIVPSGRIKNSLSRQYRVPEEIISVHPPTANLPIRPRTARHLPAREWLFLSIGALTPRKNQLALVEAANRLPRQAWRLFLVGQTGADPAYTAEIESYLRAHNLQERVFLGSVSSSDLMELLSSAHLHLFASHEEGFGMAIYETIHAGLPTAYIEENCGLGPQFQSIIPVPRSNDAGAWLHVIETFLKRPQFYEAVAAGYQKKPPSWEVVASSIEAELELLLTMRNGEQQQTTGARVEPPRSSREADSLTRRATTFDRSFR